MVAPFLTIFLLPPVPLCELLPVALASASKVQGMSPCACKSWLPLAPAAELHWHHLSNQRETISTPSLMYGDVLLHQVFLPSAGKIDPLEGPLLLHGSQRVSGRYLAEWGVPSSRLHGVGHPILPQGASSLPSAYWESFQFVRFPTQG